MRWKLLAGNIIAVLLVGVLGWFLVKGNAEDALVRDVEPSVQRAQALLDAVQAQQGDDLLEAVQRASEAPGVTAAFTADSESDARVSAFAAAETLVQQLASLPRRNRAPELVTLFNAEGIVLARNADRNLDAGRNLRREFPAVAHALEGTGANVRDYIHNGDQGWLEAAIVPVRRDGRVRGGLLVGFAVADSAARANADRIGVDVGYLFRENGRVTVQSLSAGSQREKEQLVQWANSPAAGGENLFRSSARVPIRLGDETYLAQVMPMQGVYSQQAGAIVLRSINDAKAPAGGVANPILLALALGLIIVVVVNLAVTAVLLRHIEDVENTLLQMIQGNDQIRVEVKDVELGGIVTNINTLVDRLSGSDEGASS